MGSAWEQLLSRVADVVLPAAAHGDSRGGAHSNLPKSNLLCVSAASCADTILRLTLPV